MIDKLDSYHEPHEHHEPYVQYLLLNNKSRKANTDILRFKFRNLSKSSCWFVWFVVNIFIVPYFFISCSRETQHDIIIAVSIPPQAWFVSQIAGEKAAPLILVPPGQNPHNYEPTPRQIQSLASASAWILSGSEFEISLRPKIEKLFPNLRIIDGTEGVNFRLLDEHDCDDYHDLSDNCSLLSDTSIDRHTWLGGPPAKILAEHIKNTLCNIDNDNEKYYSERYVTLINEIDNTFNELKIMLSQLNGKSVFVYHPSFGYFLDEFGIIQEAVEMGGKEPTPRQLNALMEKISTEKPAAIFVQAQFPVNAARTIANAAGAQIIELDPLAKNWLENIKFMGQNLKDIIK